ncbi:putative aldouronate transport system substrate-binding protein [Paenibacillus phyllosphaerae]|uniref:Putative aldouronate transport system substrate-binding protein n=1 Tax=Paenibacillus phyllosphaerae TaxID=274593 RepID=A0A7W5AWN0_9BACL|nr:ABC transporter substrate-binding protein [Paenibacillus phyllosphaerae]MBB3110108.1 putative aldouronate transport system substrate-binding protein [Paenibacillus phyllosphaerae]
MKNAKRVTLTVLVLMLTWVLAACGDNSGSNNGGAANNGGGEDKGDPTELTMAFISFGNMPDLELVQNEMNKITTAKINATVKLMPISISAWTQQMNLLMAGSEQLDLIVTSTLMNYSSQVAKGQLLPMNDLLEQYGEGIKSVLSPEILNATKIDGEVYGIPSTRDMAADYGVVIRKDLIDKYKVDVTQIKTFADLEPVLKLIKDGEPGVAPLVQQNQTQTVTEVMVGADYDVLGDKFGVLEDAGQGELKVVNYFESAKYKEALAVVRRWFEAGYIMKDISTSQETGPSLVKAGKAAGYVANMKPGFEVQESRNSGREMVGIRLTEPMTSTTNITSFMLSIAKNTIDENKAMQLLDLLYSDADLMNLLTNGIEGKHYVKQDDGLIAKPEGVTDTGYMLNQWEVGNNFLGHVWAGEDPQIWDKMKAFNEASIKSKALGFTFNADSVKTEIAAVTNVLNQYRVGLETGTLDPEKNLTDFNAKLKAAGLTKIIEEKQKQLDEWAKSN